MSGLGAQLREIDQRLRDEFGVHINYVRPIQWQHGKVWAAAVVSISIAAERGIPRVHPSCASRDVRRALARRAGGSSSR
jgi:hypothetical protein